MLDRRPFIDAILANPDDDAPRLVYADYLDERGDDSDRARAEFIRVSCEVERVAPEDARRAALERRQDELLDRHEADWRRGLPDFESGWNYRDPARLRWQRGFPWDVTIDAYQFLDGIERVLPNEAVFGVELRGEGPEDFNDTDPEPEWLDRLVGSRWMTLVRKLDLCETHFCLDNRPDRFVKLISSPYLTRLQELLVFKDYIGLAGVRAVVEAPAGFRLRRLLLGCIVEPYHAEVGGPEDFFEALRLVADSPRMDSLEYFDFDVYYDARDREADAARILLASKCLPRTMQLRLGSLWNLSTEYLEQLGKRFVLVRDS
jgi:uncharacterized protein (TIGR02996 family)